MISAAAGGRAGRRQVGRASRAAPRSPYGRSASGAARLLPGTGESERCHGCLLASDETAARGLLAINRKVIIRRDAIMGLGILVRPASISATLIAPTMMICGDRRFGWGDDSNAR